MVLETRELKRPLQKVIDLGIIDGWFRGLAGLVPQPSDPQFEVWQECELHTGAVVDFRFPDFNTHTLTHGSQGTISENEMKTMTGFRHLLQSSARHDVRVDVAHRAHGMLEVSFHPDEPFIQSRVFGAGCISALPAMFREWTDKVKK